MAGELEKLRIALENYLALGDSTPVADQAQHLMNAIDSGGDQSIAGNNPMDLSGQGAGGATDPLGSEPADTSMDLNSPEDAGTSDSPLDHMPPPNPHARSFGDANKTAGPRLAALNAKKKKASSKA